MSAVKGELIGSRDLAAEAYRLGLIRTLGAEPDHVALERLIRRAATVRLTLLQMVEMARQWRELFDRDLLTQEDRRQQDKLRNAVMDILVRLVIDDEDLTSEEVEIWGFLGRDVQAR